ncbi:hypothetical protein ACFL96_04205 [Thermoproteota archaeon]
MARKLILILGLLIFLAGCSGPGIISEPEPQIPLYQAIGFSEDINHIMINNLTNYSSVNSSENYLTKCDVDSDCPREHHVCLKCPDTFIFYYNETTTFVRTDRGFCGHQRRHQEWAYDLLHNRTKPDVHCLYQLDDDYIPSYYPEVKDLLPVWKKRFMDNGITQDYFDRHFYIVSAYLSETMGKEVFVVSYYFVHSGEIFNIREMYNINPDNTLDDSEVGHNMKMKFSRPVGKLISRQEAEEILKRECSPEITVTYVNLALDKYGKTQVYASGRDNIKPECKAGKVDLETGEMFGCGGSDCNIA